MLRWNFEKEKVTFTKDISKLREDISTIDKQIGSNTKFLTPDYRDRVATNATLLVGMFFFFEILFQVSMCFLSYFDYRVLIEVHQEDYLKALADQRQDHDVEVVQNTIDQLNTSSNF